MPELKKCGFENAGSDFPTTAGDPNPHSSLDTKFDLGETVRVSNRPSVMRKPAAKARVRDHYAEDSDWAIRVFAHQLD
jgi:hypothetical protein